MTTQLMHYLKTIRFRWQGFALLSLLPFTFSCMDMDSESIGNTPRAYVSFYNGTAADHEIKIEVDERVYDRKHFDYGQFIEYWYFYTGERNFSFKDPVSDQSLLDTAVTLEVEKAYSFFMAEQGGQLQTLFTEDSLDLPATGNALIRLVHLSPDSPEVSIYQGDAASNPLFEGKEFMQITDFINVPEGETDLIIKAADGNSEWARLNDVMLREGRIYTLIIRGQKEAESTSQDGLRLQLIRNYPNY
ncbi:DUF4397 domain-containing protein [Cyclobacterium jeungdonense]|uniref:DUF4397 domain-containing protein n=1 Tax=Cyclobacterium jeungdonense TaxID=708087 RepID=A0ABT8C1A5_9BACT|nr:DUF4397 domain-containing protein [Cyclobacterium jeungdonense]MDN3686590.1 DUF4397 domain-containing protein [Cyclobacterium jeungdonense]